MTLRTRLVAAVAAAFAITAAAATPARADELSPDELLARYQPVLILDRFERFAPVSVDGFLAGSDLKQLNTGGTYDTVDIPPPGLPVHGDGWRLDHRSCTSSLGLASVACYDAASNGPNAVYGRFDVVAGTIVLQYWLFYDFNFWSLQYPPSDLVWQAHEGDWEVVTVVLDEEQTPVEAAYSQHCTGQRRAWAGVQKLGDHPVVYVATGSHANQFAAGPRPISLACYPQAARDFFAAIGVHPHDVVAPPFLTTLPDPGAIERIHDNSPRWLRFPGSWGETQWVHAPAPIGTVPFGAGPAGPQLHDVWIDALGTIAGYPTA
jgi:hypothetical protein